MQLPWFFVGVGDLDDPLCRRHRMRLRRKILRSTQDDRGFCKHITHKYRRIFLPCLVATE